MILSPITAENMNKLKELEESESEYLINLIHWHEMPFNFKKIIIEIENELSETINMKCKIIQNYFYYETINVEKIIINEILKQYGDMPEWIIKKEKFIKLWKIREIIV